MTLNDTGGSVVTTWPASPGFIPTCDTQLATVWSTRNWYRQAIATQPSAVIMKTYIEDVIGRARADGRDLHVIYVSAGTNDGGVGESRRTTSLFHNIMDEIQTTYPKIHFVFFEPICSAASALAARPEIDTVRSNQRNAVNSGPGRASVNGEGRATVADEIHANLTTFQGMGTEGGTATLAFPRA